MRTTCPPCTRNCNQGDACPVRAEVEREKEAAAIAWTQRIAALLGLAIVITVFLTACGGGGDSQIPEDGHRDTQPLDCKARPEVCQ